MKSVFFLPIVLILLGSCARPPPKTSANASASEVTFLKLPSTASEIRYWDDGHNRIACFKVSEKEFEEIFPSTEFSEITTPMYYIREGFENLVSSPGNRTSSDKTKVTSGLYYQKIEKDGGGPTIIFDRERGLGAFDFAPW